MADRRLAAWLAAKHSIVGVEPTSPRAVWRRGYGPDAMCIGAQKAGTTWLYANLAYHPLVWLPPIKELHFFKAVHLEGRRADTCVHFQNQVRDARAWWTGPEGQARDAGESLECLDHLASHQLTDEWYTRIFDFRGSDQVGMDIGPGYSLLPREGIRHVLSLNPNVKVIAILRDPAERSLSHACMLAVNVADADAVWSVLRSDAMHVITQYSDYPRWLSRWRGLVGPHNMFLTSTNAIRTRPLETLRSACGFLGIPFHPDLFPEASATVFAGPAAHVITEEMRAFVRVRMERICQELRDGWPELAAEVLEPDASLG